ncbi:MAG: serine protease AprX [Acidimicrobiaceae bacterium]
MGQAKVASSARRGRRISVVAVGLLVAVLLATGPDVARGDTSATTKVIVRMLPGVTANPDELLAPVSGRVDRLLPTINGFSAWIPSEKISALEINSGVLEVTVDASLNVPPAEAATSGLKGKKVEGFVESDFGTPGGGPSFARLDIDTVSRLINADDVRARGANGTGIDVALIDTGVAPVPGIGKTINGPDLSFDSQVPGFQYLDGYGHGTHLAGIINGSGNGVNGIAPGARVVNVKVGAANGATDVVQVIAAIDWVVQHRRDNGMNIRVIALAYGTDSTQSSALDPLAYAAEVAWRHGIVVVVAAGNTGQSAPSLNDPATNPYVIAVGASDVNGTYTSGDDTVAPFSAWGNAGRRVDLVAPGRSLVSLRTPGSYIDILHPEGREADGLFRGSGTSQATAVVAGSVALLLQDRPDLTPDQVKWVLRKTAKSLPQSDSAAQGTGEIDVKRAQQRSPGSDAAQTWTPATGTGSLEAARGTLHVDMGGIALQGEIDLFGRAWDGQSWSGQSWSGVSWSGGMWLGQSWSGQSWSGQSWSGQSWSGQSWSGQSWSGQSWSGQSWSGQSWSGQSWSGQSWSGQSWSGQSWSGVSWSGQSWSGATP